jgi:heavy metal sensor kinase
MIFNSIKWRLQAWHALMLIVVLSGFGFTAYHFDRASRLQRIDRELQQRADVVLRSLREVAGHPGGSERRGGGPPNGPRGDFEPPSGRERPGPEGRPPPPPRRKDSEGQGDGQMPQLPVPKLPERDASLFAGGSERAYYFVLFHRIGNAVLKSDTAPEGLTIPERGSNNVFRVRGNLRELVEFTPPGEAVVTGLDMSAENAELRRLAWLLFGAGSGVLLLGLAGGWWLATRAIRPIRDISAAATKISAGDLSQRIATAETESELGQLAAILNSTFGRLESAFAQQQQFTSDAAHELRTPVTVILTQIQSTLNRERNGAEYRETLEACQRAAQRMRRLIESLLELARFDAGQEKLNRLSFDLAETARDCAEMIQPLAAGRRVKFETDLSPAKCEGDSERIGQVITNLLTNAVNYNKPDGEVRLNVAARNTHAVVTVTDTGRGIAPEELSRVFERFYRADKSRSNSLGGAGLGLSICKAIVEAHGGTITVSSEPGRGTTFEMRLPVG